MSWNVCRSWHSCYTSSETSLLLCMWAGWDYINRGYMFVVEMCDTILPYGGSINIRKV